MHITDKDDRPVDNYNPIIDAKVDLDAPYIDFNFAENKEDIEIPKNGVYDTLYYLSEPILTVNQVSEIEVRFYTTENPNENYRVGQRHIKGKTMDIKKIEQFEGEYCGFKMIFDTSVKWNGYISTLTLDESYVKITKTRCIAILFFNEDGKITRELIIPIADWFSPKVYLNTAITIPNPEPYPFKVNDLVDAVVYVKEQVDKSEDKFRVVEREYTGRLAEIQLVKREYTTVDENNVEKLNTMYYYILTIDNSEDYDYNKIRVASTVVKSMKIHKLPPIEH